MGQLAATFASGLVAALLALAGFWFGLKRFRTERIWEEKFKVYQYLFEALADLYEEYDQLWDAHVEGRKLSPDHEMALHEAAKRAWPIIKKRANIGSFVLSTDAEAALVTLVKEIGKAAASDHYMDFIDRRGAAFGKALASLRVAAKADLKT